MNDNQPSEDGNKKMQTIVIISFITLVVLFIVFALITGNYKGPF